MTKTKFFNMLKGQMDIFSNALKTTTDSSFSVITELEWPFILNKPNNWVEKILQTFILNFLGNGIVLHLLNTFTSYPPRAFFISAKTY